MRRETLPSGAWVDIRDKEEITQRGRRGIQSIAGSLADVLPRLKDVDKDTDMTELGLTEVQMDAVIRIQEATVVAFVAGWSLPDPVPTILTVGDLPALLFDELSVVLAKDGAEVASLSLDTSVGTDPMPDPKDPSGVSELSDGPSKGETVQGQILTSTIAGDPTTTGS